MIYDQQKENHMSELIKLSVSKAKTFEGCKKKFKYSYILRLPRAEEQTYHTLGKLVHKCLELFHKEYYELGSTEAFHVVMKKSWKIAINLQDFKPKLTEEIISDAKLYLNSYLKRWSALNSNNILPKVINCEYEFKKELEGKVLLNGSIDSVQIDPDGTYHIVDWKTSKSSKYLKKDWLQLLVYAYVLFLEKPEVQKIRGSYLMLKLDCEMVTKEFTREEILSVKDKVLDYYMQIVSETEYAANPTILCNYCEYKELCDEAKPIIEKNIKFGEVKW